MNSRTEVGAGGGFTPGPWTLNAGDLNNASIYVPSEVGCYVIAERVGGQVRKSETGCYDDYSEVEANARLIAAAPELYEALKRLERQTRIFDGTPSVLGALEQASAALAKARGESP